MDYDYAALTRRWFEEVWNRQNDAVIDTMFHHEGTAKGLTDDEGRQLQGPAGFRLFYGRMLTSFSDIHIEVQDCFATGNKSACRFTFRARHTGDGLGTPATGKEVVTTGMTITHWRDGQITHGWNEFDTATLLHQIDQPLTTQVMA